MYSHANHRHTMCMYRRARVSRARMLRARFSWPVTAMKKGEKKTAMCHAILFCLALACSFTFHTDISNCISSSVYFNLLCSFYWCKTSCCFISTWYITLKLNYTKRKSSWLLHNKRIEIQFSLLQHDECNFKLSHVCYYLQESLITAVSRVATSI